MADRINPFRVIREELPRFMQEDQAEGLRETAKALIPQTPSDVALTLAGGPGSKLLKSGALAAASAMYSPEAEAGSGPLNSIAKAIKKLVQSRQVQDQAMSRAEQLNQLIELQRYSPGSIARATTFSPAAQRGFNEGIISTRAPFSTTLIRPSQWAEHTPPLNELQDRNILEYLKKSMQEKRMQDLPALWLNDTSKGIDAGFEGRHRMKAMREMFGDEPLPVNLIRGDKFKLQEADWPKGYFHEAYQGPSEMPYEELMRQKIMFGDKPIDINPLWISDK